MPKKNGQTLLGNIGFLVFAALIIFLVVSKLPLNLHTLIFILAPIVFVITFVNTDLALIILIFSMLFSPELKISEIPWRAVVVRIDDILLLVVFFSWLAKTAINKQLGLLKRTSLNLPILAYIFACIFSTAIALVGGRVRLASSLFYLLKYVEYFMLYFLVTNNLRDKKQIKIFVVFLLIVCMLTCIYALTRIGPEGRATAPFEGQGGEPNTLGGYSVLLFAVVSGLFLYSPPGVWQYGCGALAGLIFLTLLQTLSRTSYFAFIFTFLALILLTRKKKFLLIGILISAILFLPTLMPTKVANRIKETFVPGKIYRPLGRPLGLDESASIRIDTWKMLLDRTKERPFFGYGLSKFGIIDAQYPLVLAETGIVGLWIFIWLMVLIFWNSLRTYRTVKDDWERGLALGFLAGFIGLLAHSFGSSTFIVVRIMEPFWFLAAIVMMLPELQYIPQQSIGVEGT
jgi:O-antigen ligase